MKFKPEDFAALLTTTTYERKVQFEDTVTKAVEIANAKLDEWLKEATVVYMVNGMSLWSPNKIDTVYGKETHKAKLVQIEEL